MATFYNQATLSYNNISVQSNTVQGLLLEELSITKTPLITTYTDGANITYVVSIVNNSANDYNDLTLTDDLGRTTVGTITYVPLTYVGGSAEYLVNGNVQPAITAASQTPLTFTGINVPAGGNTTIVYEAVANSFAPPFAGGTIRNGATLTGQGVNAAAEATVNAVEEPVLSIAKSMNPTTVSVGDTVTYTFTVENIGNTQAQAGDNAVVTDTFDPPLTGITVTLDGRTLTEGTEYTYDDTTGEFATTAGIITVPAATYSRSGTTGEYTVTPGTARLTVTGTITA